MPSAEEIIGGDDALDRVMHARPDLLARLTALLDDNAHRHAPDFLENLSTEDPASFAVLMQVVAGAYYLDDRVRKTIGYSGQRAIPLSAMASVSPAFDQRTTRNQKRFRPA